MVDKKEYLIRTLSRTKRKDYENYVVNAVWNRLNMSEVKPVAQQLVINNPSDRYFIDLYFPQIAIGVECDETYHKKRASKDIDRELTITDILRQLRGKDYMAIHIDVSKSYNEVEKSINACVEKIANKVQQLRNVGSFIPWTGAERDPYAYFADKTEIQVKDDSGFRTIAEALNIVLRANYKGFQNSFCIPSRLRAAYGNKYHVWFPKLAVNGRAVSSGWNNQLSLDGKKIIEFNEKRETIDPGYQEETALTFAKTTDPVTRESEYRFIGIFHRDGMVPGCENKRQWKRIDESFTFLD